MIGALAGGAVPPAVDNVPVVFVTVPGVVDVIETTIVHPPGGSDVPLAIVMDVGVTVTPVRIAHAFNFRRANGAPATQPTASQRPVSAPRAIR